jgi:hypothetical protein
VTPVVLDTSYLLAVEIANDQYHARAQRHWAGVTQFSHGSFVTTVLVLNEVVTYLSSRRLHAKAVNIGNYLLHSHSIELVQVDDSTWQAGWLYFQQHSDKTYSLTDCVSFVLMQQRGIRTAFTFDQHFGQAGFDCEP